jgi:maleate isomerase
MLDWSAAVAPVQRRARRERLAARAGRSPSQSQAALKRYGAHRLGVVTPYMPVADEQVRRFLADCGFDVVWLKGLRCHSLEGRASRGHLRVTRT